MSLLGIFASSLAPGGKDMRKVWKDNQKTTFVHQTVTDNSLEKKHGTDKCSEGVCQPQWVCCAESK